jgi:hypothetical protein
MVAGIVIGIIMIIGLVCFIKEIRNSHEMNPDDDNF